MPPGQAPRVSVASHIVDPPAQLSPEQAARAHGIDPAAAAAVLGSDASEASATAPEEEGEENIYEVMKRHMRAKQEELEAKNAQLRQQRPTGPGGGSGRPGPARPAAPPPQQPIDITRVADLSDLPAVWQAARKYLAQAARILESVLGACSHIISLTPDPAPGEVLLEIPNTQERFTNDRARAKLEEALRAVTGLPLKLRVNFVAAEAPRRPLDPNLPAAPAATVQRVPPEVIDAVKKQPVVQELMKRFDAAVTQVELLGTGEE